DRAPEDAQADRAGSPADKCADADARGGHASQQRTGSGRLERRARAPAPGRGRAATSALGRLRRAYATCPAPGRGRAATSALGRLRRAYATCPAPGRGRAATSALGRLRRAYAAGLHRREHTKRKGELVTAKNRSATRFSRDFVRVEWTGARGLRTRQRRERPRDLLGARPAGRA